MNALAEMAADVRMMAERLQEMSRSITIPDPGCGIAQAVARLRAVCGEDSYLAIDMKLRVSRTAKVTAEWSVWDGSNHHEGATLEDAVRTALAERTTPRADDNPVATVEAVVAEAVAQPF